jgi:hypothetical protein
MAKKKITLETLAAQMEKGFASVETKIGTGRAVALVFVVVTCRSPRLNG